MDGQKAVVLRMAMHERGVLMRLETLVATIDSIQTQIDRSKQQLTEARIELSRLIAHHDGAEKLTHAYKDSPHSALV